jgi:hypothetical protein
MRTHGVTILRSLLSGLAVVFALSVSLAACAGSSKPPVQAPHPSWLAGTWQGSAWEVGTGKTQSQTDVTLTFADNGTWKASTGASGTSWVVGDRVVLEGVASDGAKIRYTLKERERADGREVWGIVEASFGAAAVSLKRVR